jgi:multisubunit Na+/H+ antiporter MnhB subunit
MIRSKVVTTVIAVTALSLASGLTPAEARWGARHSGWSNAAIAAGIGAGLALAAAAASSGPYYSGYGYYPYGYVGYGYRGRCFSSGAYC